MINKEYLRITGKISAISQVYLRSIDHLVWGLDVLNVHYKSTNQSYCQLGSGTATPISGRSKK